MITFYDERGNGYGAQVELKTKNAVNGERSISGTIVSNKQVLSKLDRGWSFTFDGELYKIIYAKPKDEGKNISLSFDAVHQFSTISSTRTVIKSLTAQIALKFISRRFLRIAGTVM